MAFNTLTFVIFTSYIVLFLSSISVAENNVCASRNGIEDVCIKNGEADPKLQQVPGAKQCEGKNMSATFDDLRFDYCQKNNTDICTIDPDDKTHNIEMCFTTGDTNLSIKSAQVTLKADLILGRVEYTYPWNGNFDVNANTQYTIRVTFKTSVPTPLLGQNVNFEITMFDENNGLVLCVEGVAHVNGLVPAPNQI